MFTDTYFFKNNSLLQVQKAFVENIPKPFVYEIIRVVGGVPLFIESHFERFENSLQLSVNKVIKTDFTNLKNQISELCKVNNKYFGNIEFFVSSNIENNNQTDIFMGFVKHKYPEPVSYLEGVNVGEIRAERQNPNAKIKGLPFRLKADKILEESTLFEVLLVNKSNQITEGSKSNFFYFLKGELYTAPLKTVLPGITRKYIIKAAYSIGIKVVEKHLNTSEIDNVEAAFLSGTSLGVLPIKKINNSELNVKYHLLVNLMRAYNNLVQDYCSNYSV